MSVDEADRRPNGLQEGFSAPVAVLIDEPTHVHDAANAHGLRYFTSEEGFRRYVLVEVLGESDHLDGWMAASEDVDRSPSPPRLESQGER